MIISRRSFVKLAGMGKPVHPGVGKAGTEEKTFVRIKDIKSFKNDTWYSDKNGPFLCFDLKRGLNEIIC
jgi:hypothetical protein